MKRFHIHVSVQDLAQSIRFYSTLFGAEPVRQESDYAKWMLEDPRINFAISRRGAASGIDHIGFQVDSAEELTGLKAQLEAADAGLVEEMETACCYAKSDKYWVTDPSGIAWETFHTLGTIPTFSGQPVGATEAKACCAPAQPESAACCAPRGNASAAAACCA